MRVLDIILAIVLFMLLFMTTETFIILVFQVLVVTGLGVYFYKRYGHKS